MIYLCQGTSFVLIYLFEVKENLLSVVNWDWLGFPHPDFSESFISSAHPFFAHRLRKDSQKAISGCKTCGLAIIFLTSSLRVWFSVTLPEALLCIFFYLLFLWDAVWKMNTRSTHRGLTMGVILKNRANCWGRLQCLVSASMEDSRGCYTKPSVTLPTLIAPTLSSPCCSCDIFSPEFECVLTQPYHFPPWVCVEAGDGGWGGVVPALTFGFLFCHIPDPCRVIGQN